MVYFSSKIVHSIYTLTLGEFVLSSTTNDTKILLKWKLFPLFLLGKKITSLLKQIGIILNGEDGQDEIDEEVYRQISYSKILQLKNLHKGIYGLIISQSKNDKLKKDFNMPLIERKTNLNTYIKKIKSLTGIEVKCIDSLIKLDKYITHKNDKYIEIFNDKENENSNQEVVSFMRVALGVFNIMDSNYDSRFTIYEFAELKKSALEVLRKSEKSDGE